MTTVGSERCLGGFRLLDGEDPVGEGGQGTVRRAVCERADFAGVSVGDEVALKIIPVSETDASRWERLESMVSTLSRLDAPDIVRYYGCFRERAGVVALYVVVMEFLEGETLRARMDRFPAGLDADEVLPIFRAAAAGLGAAARAGLVHRDVKPDNIFLCSDGRARVIDFGIARREDSTATTSLMLVGSFDYMAPERTDQEFRGDERSDVFSLGVALHEALFGRLPYAQRKNRRDFAFFVRWSSKFRETSLALDGRAGRLAPGLDDVLKRALAVERADRFPDFAELSAALEPIAPYEIHSESETYRVQALLGEGGFGEVFRARRLGDGATVALKHLKRMDGEAARRFRVEARAMAALDDPAFVRFYEYFESGHAAAPQAYLAMAYLEGMPGRSLRDRMAAAGGRGLPSGEVLAAFARYAHGLAVLHAQGLVHRDIKPSNLYCPPGDVGKCAILDLGIALDENATRAAGAVPGTPDYMAPELLTGASRGSPASDVYALGACLYEALTGRTLFPAFKKGSADALEAFVVRARQGRAPRLEAPLVRVNPELERVLRRMTEPEVDRRMASAAEAELELQDLSDAFARGDWRLPPPDSEENGSSDSDTCDTREATTLDERTLTAGEATQTTQASVPAEAASGAASAPVPIHRRVIRNRRELFLVLALVIELASTAVIVWQRPKPLPASEQARVFERERQMLAERLRASEAARAKAEREASEAGRGQSPVSVGEILKREGGR